jgi:hypothetical protein
MGKAIYSAFFSGPVGNSMGLFFIGNGVLCGVDIGGLQFDGSYTENTDTQTLVGLIEFTLPANTTLVSGQQGGATPTRIPMELCLPVDFAERDYVRIETPGGPINARLRKLRDC